MPGIVRCVGQVRPATLTGFGWTARNESVNPVASTAADTGQRSGYRWVPTVAFVQSRNDGELKSPVRNTGMPRACSVRAAARSAWIAGSRTRLSIAITCAAVFPCFTHTGPYGADGRCTFSIAATRPGATSTYV